MSAGAKEKKKTTDVASADMRSVVFNLPNQLTWMRLILAMVMFALMSYGRYTPALWLFVAAASTDWLDGYLARKYNMVTTLGRILDPFADKVVVCGTFIYLAATPGFGQYLPAWMAVVVVGRELLVTALRGFLEQQGADFSASMSGKLKMVFQCTAAVASLYALAFFATELKDSGEIPVVWLHWFLLVSIWSAVLITVYSGVGYIVTAVRLLRQ